MKLFRKSKKVISVILAIALLSAGPFVVPIVVYAAEADTVLATETLPTTLGPPALIVVYRISNLCSVYDANNQLLNAFPVSTGRIGYETPVGLFQIYQHTTGSGYHPMVDGTYGRYCMRFLQGGYMFHSVCYAYPGAPEPILQEVTDIGTSVSRGCIRLNVADAAWLYNATPNGCLVAVLDY